MMIGFNYALRSVYCTLFITHSDWFEDTTFVSLSTTFLLNLAMDLGSILVVLFMNRKTIKLRKSLAKKQLKEKDEETKRAMIAAEDEFNHSRLPDTRGNMSLDHASGDQEQFLGSGTHGNLDDEYTHDPYGSTRMSDAHA